MNVHISVEHPKCPSAGKEVCCSPWGHKELDMTGHLNSNSCMVTIFILLRSCQTVSQSDCRSLPSCVWGFHFLHVFSHSCYSLSFWLSSYALVILVGMKCGILLWFWLAFPRGLNDVEHLFICLLTTCKLGYLFFLYY